MKTYWATPKTPRHQLVLLAPSLWAEARSRIVVVAIFGEPPKVDLFRFFWRELRLCGARGPRRDWS